MLLSFVGHGEHTRLIVTSDIGGSDPDDQESFVHLLTTLDQVDLEGFIYQHAWVSFNKGNEEKVVDKVLNAYGQVWSNLCMHSQGFPTEEVIRMKVKHGQSDAGMAGVGDGLDSPGSELIINIVDAPDERPVWIAAWSGVNTVAQALWKVSNTRSPEDVAKFVKKIRVYDILGQDDAGAWIVTNFPDLLYIRNKEVYGWGPSDEWIKEKVQCQGVLGKEYPDRIWASEGDSPSFMFMLENGLNSPEHIDWGGWGGRFDSSPVEGIRSMDWVEKSGLHEEAYDPYYMIGSTHEGCGAINKWRSDIMNDFAARMIWSCTPQYDDANHHPIVGVDGDISKNAVQINVRPGERISLDASDSVDPDGDSLTYEWIYYSEPSTYNRNVDLSGNGPEMTFVVPEDAGGLTMHIILRVTDDGTPALSSYRRFVFVAGEQ
ncbi:MAG: DUF1593 domain-containing protein [Muribaculaceae bacterium]|nr:DUF1593 domain-containing protein [Muribaculaceae bacterium]